MAEERREGTNMDNLRNVDVDYDNPETDVVREDYKEETAAEVAAPVNLTGDYERDAREERTTSGSFVGYASLALSILSLFFLPVILGAAGIVLGFVARRRGAESLGAWAIGIGAVSIIIGMFVLPFF